MVLAVINFVFKAAGPVLVADREPSPTVREMIVGLSPALLAGLVVVAAGPVLDGPASTGPALPGLAVAALAYLKGWPDLACIAIAVVISIGVRLVVAL